MCKNQFLFSITIKSFCLLLFSLLPITSFTLLSVTTRNVIQGHQPRFNTNIENKIKNKQNFDYFGVSYQDKEYFSQAEINQALANIDRFKDRPMDFQFSPILGLLKEGDATDLDGDLIEGIQEKTSGSVILDWYYYQGDNEIKLTNKESTFCELAALGIQPFIKITGDITLTTQFGLPNYQHYPDKQIDISVPPQRRFTLPISGICYSSPNLSYADNEYVDNNSAVFVSNLGFVPQDDFTKNFPSTGANNLYFYLVVTGFDLKNSTWQVNHAADNLQNSIKVSVSNNKATGVNGFLTFKSETMLLVTLTGPTSDTTELNAKAEETSLPLKINLHGYDTSGRSLNYEFQINKWFINRASKKDYHAKQQEWCKNLSKNDDGVSNYMMPSVPDLTNAVSKLWSEGTSTGNYYQRTVNGNLFSEWGNMPYYSGANFYSNVFYWTDYITGAKALVVSGKNGEISSGTLTSSITFGLCVSGE